MEDIEVNLMFNCLRIIDTLTYDIDRRFAAKGARFSHTKKKLYNDYMKKIHEAQALWERTMENEYWEGAYHDIFTYDKMRFEANELIQLLLLFIDRVALNQENCWSIFKHIRSLPSPGIIDEEDLEFFQRIKLIPPKD